MSVIQPIKIDPGVVIAVYSPKGGVGTTTIAANLAQCLARPDKRIMLIDADFCFGDQTVVLNLSPQQTIADLMNQRHFTDHDIHTAKLTHRSGIAVMAAPRTPLEAEQVTPMRFINFVRKVRNYYHYVILDLPTTLDPVALDVLDMAHKIFLVGIPTVATIKNLRIVYEYFTAFKYLGDKVKLVMNQIPQVGDQQAIIKLPAIERTLKHPIDFQIPMNVEVFWRAEALGNSIMSQDAAVGQVFHDMAATVRSVSLRQVSTQKEFQLSYTKPR